VQEHRLLTLTASADKQVLAGPDVVVNRLTGQLGQLKPNRSTGTFGLAVVAACAFLLVT
jgi:hypothetical protein